MRDKWTYRGGSPLPPSAADPLLEPSLEALALAEVLAQMRAAGGVPRLSTLIAARPDSAGSLADALMAAADEVAEADSLAVESGDANDDMPIRATPVPLSPGTQRALVSVFDEGDMPVSEGRRVADGYGDMPAMVAESRARYSLPESAGAREEAGLLALARCQRFDAETLAELVMLSPEVLCWLDHVAMLPEEQPDVLVAHLVGALGIERECVREVLAQSGAGAGAMEAGEAVNLVDVIRTAASLTPAQRNYWLTLLSSSM